MRTYVYKFTYRKRWIRRCDNQPPSASWRLQPQCRATPGYRLELAHPENIILHCCQICDFSKFEVKKKDWICPKLPRPGLLQQRRPLPRHSSVLWRSWCGRYIRIRFWEFLSRFYFLQMKLADFPGSEKIMQEKTKFERFLSGGLFKKRSSLVLSERN